MSEFDFGRAFGGAVMAFAVGYIVLGLLWLIPPLRRRRAVWYGTAVALTWLSGFVSVSGYTAGHAIGAGLFTGLAWWRGRQKPKADPSPAPPQS